MELYVACAKGIIDINGLGGFLTTDTLDIFLVKPVYQKSKLRRFKLIGYEEVLTGEKIINITNVRRSYDICEGRMKPVYTYDFEDSTIEGRKQIGDVSWEVVEKASADRLLTSKELNAYMSLTPEEAHSKLKDVRAKARELGQTTDNLRSGTMKTIGQQIRDHQKALKQNSFQNAIKR